ncbi:hypothetical protein M8J77_026201 [Diaphorina citri]|nr:hypothetical protein M8J77_026201 [Diaphorina citri]
MDTRCYLESPEEIFLCTITVYRGCSTTNLFWAFKIATSVHDKAQKQSVADGIVLFAHSSIRFEVIASLYVSGSQTMLREELSGAPRRDSWYAA